MRDLPLVRTKVIEYRRRQRQNSRLRVHFQVKAEFVIGANIQMLRVRLQSGDFINTDLLQALGVACGADDVGEFDYSQEAGLGDVEVIEFSAEVLDRVEHSLN
jgi:hypothetical protein